MTAVGNSLLLQPDALAQSIATKIVVKGLFVGRQSGEFPIVRVALPNPKRRVLQQRLPVHQKRVRRGEQHSQAVQYMEAVSIDVAPVVHLAMVEPPDLGQAVEAVAPAENDQAAGDLGECQAVASVLRG